MQTIDLQILKGRFPNFSYYSFKNNVIVGSDLDIPPILWYNVCRYI